MNRYSLALLALALTLAGCAKNDAQQAAPASPVATLAPMRATPAPIRFVKVHYCNAGTANLVPVPVPIPTDVPDGPALDQYTVNLLVGGKPGVKGVPPLYPIGTGVVASRTGTTVNVNFTGALTHGWRGGTTDEVCLFKSLTYTLTSLPGTKAVQILVDGKISGALPGGHLEIDQPLTRATFDQ